MSSLYLVFPFSQLPSRTLSPLASAACHFHSMPVPWALLLDLTPLVPSGLWFALSTHRHLGMPQADGGASSPSVLCTLLPWNNPNTICICLQVCLLTMENNLEDKDYHLSTLNSTTLAQYFGLRLSRHVLSRGITQVTLARVGHDVPWKTGWA